MRGRTKEEIHKELQDLNPMGSPHKEEKVIGGNIDLMGSLKDMQESWEELRDGLAFQGQQWRKREGKTSSLKLEEGEGYLYPSRDCSRCSTAGTGYSGPILDRIFCPPRKTAKDFARVVQIWGRIFRPDISKTGPDIPPKKSEQHKNSDNFCIRTPFSMILGSVESPQRAL